MKDCKIINDWSATKSETLKPLRNKPMKDKFRFL